MMNMVEFSGRGEDYFRDEARRRDAEKKRRKARGESRERLVGGGGEKASRVRRKRSRQQSEARRMWRERKEGGLPMRLAELLQCAALVCEEQNRSERSSP